MNPELVETDDRSRVVVPGHPNERFIVRHGEDGSIIFTPVVVMSEAQYEYDTNPELQALLHRAMTAPRVRRPRRKPRTS